MPVPCVVPPVLVNRKAGVALPHMPTIVFYLGEKLGLMLVDPAGRAMAMKVANDVIDELTLDGGRQMWTDARWRQFVPCLTKWMSLWEDTGRRLGLKAASCWAGRRRASPTS